MASARAAVLTIGTELTAGLRQDTNGREVARRLAEAGYAVGELRSLPDDELRVEAALRALCGAYALVVVTGGLGPTHDDITREAAAHALGKALVADPAIEARLLGLTLSHTLPRSREHLLRQALIVEGATVLPASKGTAPGQVVKTDSCTLVLLPGPPTEMRPLLELFLEGVPVAPATVRFRCTGLSESDAQHLVQPVLEPYRVELTLLAAPGDVEVILMPGAGDPAELRAAVRAVREALGDYVYAEDGSSLAEVVVRLSRERGERLTCAESCTGGLVAAALTGVAGASDVFPGAVVAYANEVKRDLLGVPEATLAAFGAVSEQTARAMAAGALGATGATLAVAITGIAGPGGGSPDKPVGLVWFAVAHADGRTAAFERRYGGDRAMVRQRATFMALDLLRRELLGGA